MTGYGLFLLMATLTVMSPGPGVLLTLSFALRHGWVGALPGIFGIVLGAFVVAGLAASGVGLVMATSAVAFSVLKYAGAGYLLYLGVRMWRSQGLVPQEAPASPPWRRFVEALSVQLLNPKAVFFFLAVFPQFIQPQVGFAGQFLVLVASYGGIVMVVHGGYALLANGARGWMASERGGRVVGRLSGGMLIGFGVVMGAGGR
ncbi:LysE family translocator [Pseudomonas plecoglossicida]|uniref:LysE family translocator n=1 Tax=Pseudomonas plecoglossicida TaxID=70775 RepID=UPI003977ADD5